MHRRAGRLPAGRALAGLALAALAAAGGCGGTGGGGGSAGVELAGRPRHPPPGRVELLAFTAAGNPACRLQAPVSDRIAERYRGRVAVRSVDLDAASAEEARGVTSCPAFVVLADGREARRLVGLQNEAELARVLDDVLDGG